MSLNVVQPSNYKKCDVKHKRKYTSWSGKWGR